MCNTCGKALAVMGEIFFFLERDAAQCIHSELGRERGRVAFRGQDSCLAFWKSNGASFYGDKLPAELPLVLWWCGPHSPFRLYVLGGAVHSLPKEPSQNRWSGDSFSRDPFFFSLIVDCRCLVVNVLFLFEIISEVPFLSHSWWHCGILEPIWDS